MFRTKSKNYQRSNNYRDEYFSKNSGYKRNNKDYHCAYCGRKLKKNKAQVDHIFSVHKSQSKLSTRMLMRLFGIVNVNSYKNLTAACEYCNKKKGAMGNGWIISGFLGKSIWFHRIKFVFKLMLVVSLCYLVYYLIK